MKKIFCALFSVIIALAGVVNAYGLSTSATAAVLMDKATGTVLYAKNADDKRGIASTTKIMTAVVILENCELSSKVTIPAEAAGITGTSMYLKAGEELTVKDLLYGMLLLSGNDAAAALAIHLSGSVAAFAQEMNKKAAELNMSNSHFTNPSGLTEKEHYSTAYDMALLTKYALGNSIFAAIVSTYSAKLTYGTPATEHTLINHNKLLKKYEGAVGVKTGYTDAAGRCLVSAAERSGCTLIAVTLNDGDDWVDHTAMLDYGFSKLHTIDCSESYKINLVGGAKASLKVKAVGSSQLSVPETAWKNIEQKVFIKHFIYAPAQKGEVVGEVCYYCEGDLLLAYNLVLEEGAAAKGGKNSGFFEKIFSFWRK